MRIASTLLASAALFAIVQAAPAQTPAPLPTPVPAQTPVPATATAAPAASPEASATPSKRRYHKKAAAATPVPGEAASPAPAGPQGAASPLPATPARAKRTPPRLDPNATPAPGGGPGMVWVNTKSKVYHMSTSRYYGKTKEGKYMTEQAAQAEGDHAAPHGE